MHLLVFLCLFLLYSKMHIIQRILAKSRLHFSGSKCIYIFEQMAHHSSPNVFFIIYFLFFQTKVLYLLSTKSLFSFFQPFDNFKPLAL